MKEAEDKEKKLKKDATEEKSQRYITRQFYNKTRKDREASAEGPPKEDRTAEDASPASAGVSPAASPEACGDKMEAGGIKIETIGDKTETKDYKIEAEGGKTEIRKEEKAAKPVIVDIDMPVEVNTEAKAVVVDIATSVEVKKEGEVAKVVMEDIAMPVEVISFAQHASKEVPPAFGSIRPTKAEATTEAKTKTEAAEEKSGGLSNSSENIKM